MLPRNQVLMVKVKQLQGFALQAAVLTAIGLLCPSTSAAQLEIWGQEAVEGPFYLAPVAHQVATPRVKSRDYVTAIYWVERNEAGESWISHVVVKDAALRSAEFLPGARRIEPQLAGVVGDLDVAIHPTSMQPAVAWVRESPDGNAIMFAERGGDPIAVHSTGSIAELPSVAYDEGGSVYIVWSEVTGGQSVVMCSSRNPGDTFTTRRLSTGVRPYDVLPQVFGETADATLTWYSMEGGEVYSRFAIVSAATGTVESAGERIEGGANRLPLLFRVPGEMSFGTLWLEQETEGESYLILDPRSDYYPEPEFLGARGSLVELPSVSSDPFASAGWVETLVDGSRWIVAENPHGVSDLRIRTSESLFDCTHSVSGNWVHLVWTEDGPEAEGSLVYFRAR